MGILWLILLLLRRCLSHRAALVAENLALRHQLAVLQRSIKRPRVRQRDRIIWFWLSRLWSGWRSALVIVQPDIVVRWQREGFRLYWRWKCGKRAGRPPVSREIRDLIHRMAKENPTWGAPRILSELLLLGHQVAESTVSKYMPRSSKPPSQTWRTFLANHTHQIVACDFLTVPTATFRVLYVFLVLQHDRRRVVHFNITTNPTVRWAAQQIVEAFPFDGAPRFLLRDRDRIYSREFSDRVEHMGIKQVLTAPRAPWQNPYVERMIGSIRRECLDHVIVLNEDHLNRILTEYFDYYHDARSHLSLERNSPNPRAVETPTGKVVSKPYLGGLHHLYSRVA